MALITVNCPHCGKEVSAQNEWNGMNIGCPSCSQNFMLNIAVQSGDVNWHWAFIFIPGIHFVLFSCRPAAKTTNTEMHRTTAMSGHPYST